MTNRRRLIAGKLAHLIATHPEAFASLTPEQQGKIVETIERVKNEPALLPRYPAKLVNRCECGRQISNHKFRCKACHELFLQDLGSQIENQDLLDAVLKRSAAGHEKLFLEQLRPYLKFEPAALA